VWIYYVDENRVKKKIAEYGFTSEWSNAQYKEKEDIKMNKVWYACYGSNILYERFMHYIEGGTCRFNGKPYDGCKDKTPPAESRPILIPYEMYFGNKSSRWGGLGAAFLDLKKPAITVGRAYLITEEQFDEVWKQEGPYENWYGKIVELGTYNGYQVRTFTNANRRPENAPSPKYLEIIEAGMKELIGESLISCIGKS
jgi:hypothetical protein